MVLAPLPTMELQPSTTGTRMRPPFMNELRRSWARYADRLLLDEAYGVFLVDPVYASTGERKFRGWIT